MTRRSKKRKTAPKIIVDPSRLVGRPLPPCPHCRAQAGVYRNSGRTGLAAREYDQQGVPSRIVGTVVDGLLYGRLIRCAACDRIRNDVRLAYGQIIRR